MPNFYSRFLTRRSSASSASLLLSRNNFTSYVTEGSFNTVDGWQLPVFKGYRYGKKKTWLNFGGLAILDSLNRLGLLDAKGCQLLKKFCGERTLGVPLAEIAAETLPYLLKHKHLFIVDSVPDVGKRVLRPDAREVSKRVTVEFNAHKRHLKGLKHMKWASQMSGRPRVLEVGFISGGESLVAFEQLGMEAHGVDYFYGGQFDGVQRWQLVRDITNTQVDFHVGDITKQTHFDDNFFDLVYSAQTIEHIRDLPAAFTEMSRILRPGGVLLHIYDPFFHAMGGHSFGILDCPWGHMQVDRADQERYLREMRPFEADVSIEWIKSSLNPQHLQANVQRQLVESGFDITEWSCTQAPSGDLQQLSPKIVDRAFSLVPNITLSDLTTSVIKFAAVKHS